MPRNHESNDLDLVPIDTGASQPAKTPAPAPWPMPTFQPLEINNPLTHGQGNLPEDVRPDDPYAIFSLFFDEDTLQILVTHTNKYADLHPAAETPFARPWISSLGFAQEFAKSVEASAISRTNPAAIERMSPSCTPGHAPIDRSSAANVGRREEKRKLGSDAVAAPNPQAEVRTTPPSELKGNSTFVQLSPFEQLKHSQYSGPSWGPLK